MRVTLVTHFPGRGGSTEVLKQISAHLTLRGHQVSVVCGSDDPAPIVADYRVVPAEPTRFRRRSAYVETIMSTCPDVVHIISGLEEFDVQRFLRVPRAHHIASLERHEFTDIPFLIRRTARFTELFSANTPDVVEAVRQLGSPSAAYLLAPYRLHERWLTPPESLSRETAEPVEICFVARVEHYQKRAHWLGKVISEVARQQPNFCFHVVGDGPLLPGVREDLARFGDRVQFHGWLSGETTRDVYARCDLFFLCSRWEGLPVAMAEAMCAGVAPVVPAGPGGMKAVVAASDGGWTYSATDATAGASALLHAMADRREILRRRRNASRWATEFFAPAHVERCLDALVQEFTALSFNGCALRLAPHVPPLLSTSLPRTIVRRMRKLLPRLTARPARGG